MRKKKRTVHTERDNITSESLQQQYIVSSFSSDLEDDEGNAKVARGQLRRVVAFGSNLPDPTAIYPYLNLQLYTCLVFISPLRRGMYTYAGCLSLAPVLLFAAEDREFFLE